MISTEILYVSCPFHSCAPEGETVSGNQLDVSYLLNQNSPFNFAEEVQRGETAAPGTKEGNEDKSDNTEATDEPEVNSPLTESVQKFDSAMMRACTPDTITGLFDKLGGSVTGVVGQVDEWMSSLFGAMTKLESDSTALYEWLEDSGTLWSLLKSNYVFCIYVLAGILLLVIYLLCCVPKLCYKSLRRMCCCSKCCTKEFKFYSRVGWAVVLAALAVVGVAFGCLTLKYQLSGVKGAKQLHCQTFVFAEETLRGTASLNGTNSTIADSGEEKFEGLLPLIDSVSSLTLLVDGSNPDNILEQSKRAATEALDVDPLGEMMDEAIDTLSAACTAFSANNSLSGGFHKSLWCDGTNSATLDLRKAETQMKSSAKKIVDSHPKKRVDEIFKDVKLPVINIKASFPIETIENLFSTTFDALASSEGMTSRVLQWLAVGLSVDVASYLVILLLVTLWTVWFLCRGSKAPSNTPAILWNLLTWVAFVFLVFGGVLGWLMTMGRQGCSIITTQFLEEEKWGIMIDYAPVVEPLVSQCLAKEGDGDLLEAVGLNEAYEETLDMAKQTLENFPNSGQPVDPITSELAEGYLKAAAAFGTLVAADPNSVAESRKNVFPQFLQSGLQVGDVDIDGQPLYGLVTIESLVSPWKLQALHPDEAPDGEFIVGEASPIEADSKYVKWLADLKENKKAELKASGSDEVGAEAAAEIFKEQTKNGIWWLQQKQKLLNQNFKCKRQGEESECTYGEMFGLDETQMQASNLYNTQLAAGRNYIDISSCFANAVSGATRELTNKLISQLEALRKYMSCRFLRRNVVQVAFVACDSVVSEFYYVALYRSLGGALACVVILILFILWRKLKYGQDGKSSPAPASNV